MSFVYNSLARHYQKKRKGFKKDCERYQNYFEEEGKTGTWQ